MQIEIADKTTREEYTLDWSQSKVFLVYMHTGTTVVYCTSNRAKKVVISLIPVAVIPSVVSEVLFTFSHFFAAVVPILPVAILIINLVVVIKVRRAAIHSAANLGVQPHQQSTSAVPTVMLVATSLIYVLFCATTSIFFRVACLTLASKRSPLCRNS